MDDITQGELKELLDYNPDTGVFTIKKKYAKNVIVGKVVGTGNGKGYLRISLINRRYLSHRLAWLYVHGEWPDDQIDHINHDRSDNRIENLRCVSNSGNQKNATITKRNRSGVVGVHWNKSSRKWHAQIKNEGVYDYLGLFDSLDDARKARKRAEKKYGYHQNHGKPQ